MNSILILELFIHFFAVGALFFAARSRDWRDWGLSFTFIAAIMVGVRRIGSAFQATMPMITDVADAWAPLATSTLLFIAGVMFYLFPYCPNQKKEPCNATLG